jgi:hypothetical protein
MTDHRKLPRRRHSRELMEQILAECAQPGASVAGIALTGQSHRRAPAASLDADRVAALSAAPVKTGSPNAYRERA